MFTEPQEANLLVPFLLILIKVINLALDILVWLIIIRALFSWVNPNPYNRFVRMIYRLTEPVLSPIRRMMPGRNTGIDLSPVVAIVIVMIVQAVFLPLLKQLLLMFK